MATCRVIERCGLLRREDPKCKYVLVRSSRYLNNIVEQDHSVIKRRCAWMTGFKSFPNAANTLAGIELAHPNSKVAILIRARTSAAGIVIALTCWMGCNGRTPSNFS